ncbi:hypothetical protein [Pacificibacter marinus]|uniref:hypothetical protein n=1 Tax=Pacificibacter marinus TaxID=658057 RepID=UPI001C06A609|nr:hypothetical protein [Pacificibacter marinus]MBU2865915.1 hypothetical protein [Pacificibacter marinus]
MSRRIVIHAGFHKTGTKTLQATLAQNSALLLPHVELYLQQGALISALSQAVLDFSGNRCKDTKANITAHARAFFALVNQDDPRPVLVSSESLAGHFPGSSGVGKYEPAPIAMELIRDAWIDVAGDADSFETYYTTRREGWLASCHWQRLKNNRCTISLDDYVAKYAVAADHDKIINDLRVRLGDQAVHTTAIEDLNHPIDPLLDILNLTHLRSDLILPESVNVSLSHDIRAQLLELNRRKLWGKDFKTAKAAILRTAP